MTNRSDLTRSDVDGEIDRRIRQRMKDAGESFECAQLSFIRTSDGRALWEKSHHLMCAESAGEGTPAPAFSDGAAALVVQEAKLEDMICQRMADHGESREKVEIAVVTCSEGRALWESARALRLAESQD